MSFVSPSQSNAGDTIEASDINNPVNQLAAVINGNIDVTNIADGSITTTKLAGSSVTSGKVNFGGSGAGIWWEEIGRTPPASSGSSLSLTTLPQRKYLQVIVTAIYTGTVSTVVRFNNDSASNYVWRSSANGAADVGGTAATGITVDGDANVYVQMIFNITNTSSQEKNLYGQISVATAGTATNNSRIELSGKWANTSAAITRLDIINTNVGSYAIGSEMIVLGHD